MDSKIPSQSADFSAWYNALILAADIADYGPARGTMIIKPYGYAIWEHVQRLLDTRIKAAGVQNCYFPLLIPEKLLTRESHHIQGFAPEVAWVTEGGGEKLEERLAIRPTSETIMYDTFSRWIHSWRDLPYMVNQWANVMRWEKRTRLFFRTSEFLWQEGHTVHATYEEAAREADRALRMYEEFSKEVLCLMVTPGKKPEHEKFAGAEYTLSIESLMRDCKGLQMGTSHHLGNGFANVYGIRFTDEHGIQKIPYQTSWGVSTRMLGGVFSGHGDDKGLILPPALAPYQVVIIPISKSGEYNEKINEAVAQIVKSISQTVRVFVDQREYSPGWKFNEWEMKGVPLRIEIGPRDLSENKCVIVDRLSGEKQSVSLTSLIETIPILLKNFSQRLFSRHEQFTKEHTALGLVGEDFYLWIESGKGQVLTGWDGTLASAEAAKARAKAVISTLPLAPEISLSSLNDPISGKKAQYIALWTKVY